MHIGRPILQVGILTASIALTAMSVPSAVAQDHAQLYKIYQSFRPELQHEFEKAVKDFASIKKSSTTDKEFSQALDSVKTLLYNKAYTYILCIRRAPKGNDPKLRLQFANDCVNDQRQSQQRVFSVALKLTRQPTTMVLADRCFDQTRLKEAEQEFPPFDFLSGSGVHLYDMKTLDECLARIRLP